MILSWCQHCARHGYERTWWKLLPGSKRQCVVCGKMEVHDGGDR